MKKQLINTLLTVTAISLSVLPAQAVSVNEQLTAEQNAQFQSAEEQIKEATTSASCIQFSFGCW